MLALRTSIAVPLFDPPSCFGFRCFSIFVCLSSNSDFSFSFAFPAAYQLALATSTVVAAYRRASSFSLRAAAASSRELMFYGACNLNAAGQIQIQIIGIGLYD